MKTRAHWAECNNSASYHAAQNLAFQLREIARDKGYDPRGIKVLTKENASSIGSIADSIVLWEEGPMCWAYNTEYTIIPGIYVEPNNDHTVTFYDI